MFLGLFKSKKEVLGSILVSVTIFLILFFLFKGKEGGSLKVFFVFLSENIITSLTTFLAACSIFVFVYHWKFVGTKTWMWRKIAFILLLFSYCIDKINLEKVYFTGVQKAQMKEEYNISLDSIRTSLKAEYNAKESKLSFKLDQSLRDVNSLKDKIDSIGVIAKVRKEKIESLNQAYLTNSLTIDSLLNLVAILKKENVAFSERNEIVETKEEVKPQKPAIKRKQQKKTEKPMRVIISPGKRNWH